MKFQERSFIGSQAHWPKPEVLFDENEKLLTIITPWGSRGTTKKITQTMIDYFVSSKTDHEATMPFARLTNISDVANNLRIAVLLANETIINEENRDEYTFGAEVISASFENEEFTWVGVGGPHVLLARDGLGFLPISVSNNLSSEFSTRENFLAPLPKNIIGIDTSPHIEVKSFRPREGDKIFFMSHSWIPSEIFTLNEQQRSLDIMAKILANFRDTPFWIAELEF